MLRADRSKNAPIFSLKLCMGMGPEGKQNSEEEVEVFH